MLEDARKSVLSFDRTAGDRAGGRTRVKDKQTSRAGNELR
jgi:hypothetical protein